jgi:hypothetical protein
MPSALAFKREAGMGLRYLRRVPGWLFHLVTLVGLTLMAALTFLI